MIMQKLIGLTSKLSLTYRVLYSLHRSKTMFLPSFINSALHCAASPGHLEICELLLSSKADPTIVNNDKNLALHYLARRFIIPADKKKAKERQKNAQGNSFVSN